MMTVVGLYDSESAARQAARALRDNGFEDAWVHVEAHGADESTFTRGRDLRETLTDSGVPADEASYYAEGVRRGGSLLILEVEDEDAQRAAALMEVHEPIVREDREADWRSRGYTGYDRTAPRYRTDEAERERARYARGREEHLTEGREELHVGKREVRGGGVRLHKRVTERPVEERVQLREEEVDVDRRPASRDTATDGNLFREETIEMRERREEPVVEKTTQVTGEVVARKEAHTRTETVRDTVRETHVDVERIGRDDGYREHDNTFREHFNRTFGHDERFEAYEPAYRWGYAYGSHDNLNDYGYEDVEPELRSSYEERNGQGSFERVKECVREGYNRAHAHTTA